MSRAFALTCSLLLGTATVSHAQIKEWNPSCAQILSLGWERYASEYDQRTNDGSTAGMVQSAARYQKCREDANGRALQVLAAYRRERVQSARSHLNSLEETLWYLVIFRNGEGTLYTALAARNAASRSEAMGDLIAATRRAKRSRTARNQANLLWRQTAQIVKSWDAKGQPALIVELDEDLARREYANSIFAARRHFGALQVLASRLTDEAALVLARRVNSSVKTISNV